MHPFLEEYKKRLGEVRTEDQVKGLYRWLWEHQQDLADAIDWMNRELRLSGDFEFRTILPVFCAGAVNARLRVMGVNPAYRKGRNNSEGPADKAGNYCQRSPENYLEYTLGYFCHGPRIEKERSKYWSKALHLLRLYRDLRPLSEKEFRPDRRWIRACQSSLVSGWDVFPFWSTKDGISRRVGSVDWVRDLALTSIQAAVNLGARVMVVASPEGANLLVNELYSEAIWSEMTIGEEAKKTCLAYCRPAGLGGDVSLVAIKRQVFANARHPGYKLLLQAIMDDFGVEL